VLHPSRGAGLGEAPLPALNFFALLWRNLILPLFGTSAGQWRAARPHTWWQTRYSNSTANPSDLHRRDCFYFHRSIIVVRPGTTIVAVGKTQVVQLVADDDGFEVAHLSAIFKKYRC
jgi:hypothetical protein